MPLKFLIDECVALPIAKWFAERFDTKAVLYTMRGAPDHKVLAAAVAENRILVTDDIDYQTLVFREDHPHCGIILLRLNDKKRDMQFKVLQKVVDEHAHQLASSFVVATEMSIRITYSVGNSSVR